VNGSVQAIQCFVSNRQKRREFADVSTAETSSSRRGRILGGGRMLTVFACIRKSSIMPRRSHFGLSQA
jgi:hypothetical protein